MYRFAVPLAGFILLAGLSGCTTVPGLVDDTTKIGDALGNSVVGLVNNTIHDASVTANVLVGNSPFIMLP